MSNPKHPNVVELHIISAVLKPFTTSSTQAKLQELREVMGGHGYSKLNMIGLYKDNNDVTNTFEGDNTVLQQQTSKFIIENVNKYNKFEVINLLHRF